MFVLFLLGAVAGAAAYHVIARPPAVATTVREDAPQPIRDEHGITIPDGSPLRGKLTVAPVGEKEIRRNLVLPAVVEADPAEGDESELERKLRRAWDLISGNY